MTQILQINTNQISENQFNQRYQSKGLLRSVLFVFIRE